MHTSYFGFFLEHSKLFCVYSFLTDYVYLVGSLLIGFVVCGGCEPNLQIIL